MSARFSSPMIRVFLMLILCIGLVARAQGGWGHCHCCQGDGPCEKVCRLVPDKKKVPVTCWGCKTEDFCIPGPSKPACRHCEIVCDENDPDAPCTQSKKFFWTEWIPNNCAHVYTKHKLMKKTVNKSVPSYKWVVEDLCPECLGGLKVAELPADAQVPPPPQVDAKIIYGQPPAAAPVSAER